MNKPTRSEAAEVAPLYECKSCDATWWGAVDWDPNTGWFELDDADLCPACGQPGKEVK